MKKYILLLVAAAFTLTSCDDWLNRTPESQLSPDSYFKTATDLQLFTNPLYNNLLPKTPYSEESDQYVRNSPSNLIKGGVNRQVPNSGGGWTWTQLRRINTCIDNIKIQTEDENVAKQYTALCKFFRAYFYFDKVQRFGDVPWLDHEPGTNDPALYAPRDSREVIMTHMIEDINEAVEGLPSSYGMHNFRATKWAALALKSRFCLYEGTYRKYHGISYPEHDYKYYLEESYKAAEQLMNEGGFKLYSTGNPDLDYTVLFSQFDECTSEFILSINFDYGTQLFHDATAFSIINNRGRLSLTKKFADSYLMKDGSRFTDKENYKTMLFAEEVLDRDPRFGQTVRIPGYARLAGEAGSYKYDDEKLPVDYTVTLTGYQVAKFLMPVPNSSNDRFDQSYNDLCVFRLGEVYLNYAEAKAEYGNLTQSDIDKSINLLRDRAGMPHLNVGEANANPDPFLQSEQFYPDVTGENAGIILEIRRERAIELAEEGFRYGDLMRWKHGEHIAEPYYGVYFPGIGEYDIDGDGKLDYCIYTGSKPSSKATLVYELGKDVFLSEGDKGYIQIHKNMVFDFNPKRDYLYPIPIDDRTLNPQLAQNPGWDDGLDY